MADDAHGAGAVVLAPGNGRRGEGAHSEALVRVDVGGEEQRELAQTGELPRDKALEGRGEAVAFSKHWSTVLAAQAQVDVAGVPLELIELGHKGYRAALLGGDLLGAVLVDRVPVRGRERAVELEVDLVLPVVALALGVLNREPRPRHRVPYAPQERLDARRAQKRVVHVVVIGGLEVPVALAPGLLVSIHEDEELELRAYPGLEVALGEALELAPEDLARRGYHRGAVLPNQVAHRERRPLLPGHDPQGREVRLEDEVPVALLPGAHGVALDCVHLDVDGEQVVAALRVVLDHLVEEVGGGEALALQAALHVHHPYEDGIYPSCVYLRL